MSKLRTVTYAPCPFSPAALAAARQGKYLQMRQLIMRSKKPLTERKLWCFVNRLHLKMAQFQRDVRSKAIDQQLRANTKLVRALNITNTPLLFLPTRKWRMIQAK